MYNIYHCYNSEKNFHILESSHIKSDIWLDMPNFIGSHKKNVVDKKIDSIKKKKKIWTENNILKNLNSLYRIEKFLE